MRPYTRSIIELFDGKKRYLIPLYQRQYAWTIDPHLELLWEDIERAVKIVETNSASLKPHFMGPIVIAQIGTYGKQVQAFEVIDGQQRLTTFQLLLSGFRDVAAKYESSYKLEIERYLFNYGVMEREDVERYKLWPSAADRRAFVSIIDSSANTSGMPMGDDGEDGVIRPSISAVEYFREKIEKHVTLSGTYNPSRAEKLFEALRAGLAVVSIELEVFDDAQMIFETLNSRGVELSAADLMRNFIFQRAKGLGQSDGTLNIDQLYTDYWLPLDKWFWREGTTRGKQTRARLDWLLVDHLTMKRAELTSVESLFNSYRRWIYEAAPFASVQGELASITESARVHRRLADTKAKDALARFGRLSKAFDVSTATPLVMYLSTEADLGNDLWLALSMIESFIVRRDICALSTKNYNRFFVDAIARLRKTGKDTLSELRSILSREMLEIHRWPRDREWQDAWMGRDQYKASRQPRLRYIFEEIEKKKRTKLSEEIEIVSELTIEHIMPQKWRVNWPVPGFDQKVGSDFDEERALRENERQEHIDEVGNLTLLTHSLNSKISNGPFSVKLPAVKAHASLILNRELSQYQKWDEETIQHRGAALFEIAKTIWQSPSS